MVARALACMFLVAACVAPRSLQESDRPNIVLIFTDDQGFGDVGVHGATGFATPNFDQLAAEGIRFSDFYVAQPVCSASRAALLTGCYPNRIGIHGALSPSSKIGIADGEVTLAELCRSRGYATAMFGKWHLGCQPQFSPLRHGFDEFLGIPYSNDMWPFHPDGPKPWKDLPLIDGEEVVGLNTDQSRFTDDFTTRSEQFIRRSVADSTPFFLYLAHPMPHVPISASEPFRGRTEHGLYGDVIEEIDDSLGRILGLLDELDIAGETLVIFTCDNGPWLSYGNHAGTTGGFREGKGTTFEGGVRVPCAMRLPGVIPAGHVSSEPVMTIDVLPTIAKLIGAELPEHPIDGRDIGPLLRGEPDARSPHDVLLFYYRRNELQALRAGRWKLHLPHGYRSMEGRELGRDGRPGKYDYSRKTGTELYDLVADPFETTDLAATKPEVVERMIAHAESARAELGDSRLERLGSGVREPGRVVSGE